MPVYEYECKECEVVFEVQQRISDKPLTSCQECGSAVTKLMSMSSFQLKGGGWYSDGYSSTPTSKGAGSSSTKPEAASACQAASGCSSCPAAATG